MTIKTHIQFPDALYDRLKALAAEQEWSFAETLRRGAELLLATRPVSSIGGNRGWSLDPPARTELRDDPFSDDNWRLEPNSGVTASELAGMP